MATVNVDARDAERFVRAMDSFMAWMDTVHIDLAEMYVEGTRNRIRELEDENGMLAEEVSRLQERLGS